MKKIIYIISLALLVFTACDPMEDIYNNEEIANPLLSTHSEYTLIEDDYSFVAYLAEKTDYTDTINAALIKSNKYFSEVITAKKYIPAFIAQKYPALGKNSTMVVTYDFYLDYPEYLEKYNAPDILTLTEENYKSVGIDQSTYKCFIGDDNPDKYIPGFLTDSISNPKADQVSLVLYKYAESINDPSVTLKLGAAEYQTIIDHVKNDIDATYVKDTDDSEYYYGAGSKYKNFDKRLSKRTEYSIPGFTGLSDTQADSLMDERIVESLLYLLGEKYPDAQPTVNGDTVYYNLTYATYDDENKTCYIVLKCVKSGATPEFKLVEGPSTKVLNYSKTILEDRGDYYQFQGSEWVKMSGVLFLGSKDYAEMGAPGKYNNFSSSISPENYLPKYLSSKNAYPQAEDSIIVAYSYSTGKTTIVKAEKYTYNTEWLAYKPVEPVSDQYINNGEGWVFDPSISHAMTPGDFQIIVDYVKENIDEEYVNSYGTAENYYGADAYHNNFDIRDDSFEEEVFRSWEEAVSVAFSKVLLPSKYPEAQAQVNGVEMRYKISYATFGGKDDGGEMSFRVTKSAPNPEFELVIE